MDLANHYYQVVSMEINKLKFKVFEINNICVTELFVGICLAEVESGLDTNKVSSYPPIPGTQPPPYKSYGIFQVL